VRSFVDSGYLVRIVQGRDMELHDVSFPYARPEVRLFLERLSSQYRSACGEKLVVTSLTRPLSEQPRNASDRSVHPTGMALDLRRSNRSSCRTWLESTLIALEGRGVLEATRERRPPHYHLALYPSAYAKYVSSITGAPVVRAERPEGREPSLNARVASTPLPTPSDDAGSPTITHTVSRGESLWTIARRYGLSEEILRSVNGIAGDRIVPGQRLRVPTDRGASGPESVEHRVRRGESLSTIAQAFGVRINAIRSVNGIRGSRILVGEVLTIPLASSEGLLQYTVEEGESLWIIADRHGTTVEELRRTNGIPTSRIYPGQTLNVPFRF
jgi:LysM repeat protein